MTGSSRAWAGFVASAALVAGCQRSQLPECQRLNAALAEASVEVLRPSHIDSMSGKALELAARKVRAIPVTDANVVAARDEYATEVEKLVPKAADDPATARVSFDTETRKALDGVNVVCSGQR